MRWWQRKVRALQTGTAALFLPGRRAAIKLCAGTSRRSSRHSPSGLQVQNGHIVQVHPGLRSGRGILVAVLLVDSW